MTRYFVFCKAIFPTFFRGFVMFFDDRIRHKNNEANKVEDLIQQFCWHSI